MGRGIDEAGMAEWPLRRDCAEAMARDGAPFPKRKREEGVLNEYRGVHVESTSTMAELNGEKRPHADAFFRQYVSERKPVVLRNCVPDDAFRANRWTLSYLKEKAGEVDVRVEVRTVGQKRGFGEGNFIRTKMAALVDQLAAGEQKWYMTTQDAGEDETGRPALLGPPLNALTEDFPLRPDLLRTLVPSTLNVWMGSSSTGSSSGLHHDQHDNLYCLLQGKKEFKAFSPENATKMQTYGEIAHIHPNGRINYANHPTRADGASLDADVQLKTVQRRKKAEEEVENAEVAVAAGKEGAEDRLAKAEQELELLLDEALEHGDAFSSGEEEEGEDLQERTAGEPDHFCKVSSEGLDVPYLHCTLYPGDMLYLPAGWFHEVTSSNMDGGSASAESSYHMAFNYWFHPPDTREFDRPYNSTYWEEEWAERCIDGVVHPSLDADG